MRQCSGYIHSFQSMGAVDGPGLRYVVFMQGCSLRCAYCHNPDTWEFGKGQEYTPKEVAARIERYLPYLENGGVTVTGGEPLMQPGFVEELFRSLHEKGVHTALDTSGIGDIKKAEKVLKHTDLVLADVKFLSRADYEQYCGTDFLKVKEFLDLTRQMQVPLWVRRVVVPGINDSEKDIEELSDFLTDYPNTEKIELLPFRKLCLEKYEELGIPFVLAGVPEMSEAGIEELKMKLPEKYR